eukprot:g9419.t1
MGGTEQVIDGIKHDSVELVRAALRHKFSNPEERLEAAGPSGGPFSFANAAIFTQEQMDCVVEDLKISTRKINAETKRFVSDSEWLSIDQALVETGTYASVFMSRATGGDTGLHIAITLGRLRAAQVFVEEGCDATILNDEGVCAVSILSDNFAKIMELVLRIAELEEINSRRVVTGRRLTAEQKASLAQQERVVNKANEYRLFGHGLACYFVDRLCNWRALQEEERACEIEGREMDRGSKRELRLCEVMCRHAKEYRKQFLVYRTGLMDIGLGVANFESLAPTSFHRYLGQCETIRDREHPTLPTLTPAQLESKAERFTGVFSPRRGRGLGRRRRGWHGDGADGGESQSHAAPTVGANASLATRFMLCSPAAASESDDEDFDAGDRGWEREPGVGNRGESPDVRQPRRDEEGRDGSELDATATLVSSLSSATSGESDAKGISARIAAAQKQASTNISTIATFTNNNTSSPSYNSHAEAAVAVATNASSNDSTPPPFRGRSLMSAEWISKRGASAVGRRGQQRYATKGLTPGSWTATEHASTEGGMGATAAQEGVWGRGASGGGARVGSGTGYLTGQQGGDAAASNKTRGDRVTKRGLGRGWEGLYQVRSFEDTPDEE